MTKKSIEQTFKKLTDIEHVLHRPSRYLGVIATSPSNTYVIKDNKVEWKTINYSPAFLKLFDEIISNSADFSKRPEGKHLNKIEVEIDKSTGFISVYDNGGIPVVKHKEYNQYVPDMIFGELRSGSNFDDEADSVSTGQNGEGSSIVNIFSTEFIVDTADGKNRFLGTFRDNLHKRDTPKISKSSKNYTKITYLPDYSRLGITLDDDHFTILERRTYEIAATNPHLKVYLNGKLINFKSFKDFVSLFSDNAINFGTDRFQAAVFHSKDGFQQINFVNSTNVFQGGTHIDALMNTIVSGIRDHIKKKTKQDIKPSDIKNHFFLMGTFTINNPRYNSQTKEYLQTAVKDFGMSLDVPDKVIQQIIKSEIVQEIIEWAENKKTLEELAALKKKNKDLDKNGNSLRNIIKYEPATSKDRSKCVLFVTEGDCLEENTLVMRYDANNGVLSYVPIRDIEIGDCVLTHRNRLRPVSEKIKKVVDGIKIHYGDNSIIVSPDHKMIVYDKIDNQFVEMKAIDIDYSRHSLVKNRLVDMSHVTDIIKITKSLVEGYDLQIIYGDDVMNIIDTSLSHKFLIWDCFLGEFSLVTAENLDANRHKFVMSDG